MEICSFRSIEEIAILFVSEALSFKCRVINWPLPERLTVLGNRMPRLGKRKWGCVGSYIPRRVLADTQWLVDGLGGELAFGSCSVRGVIFLEPLFRLRLVSTLRPSTPDGDSWVLQGCAHL